MFKAFDCICIPDMKNVWSRTFSVFQPSNGVRFMHDGGFVKVVSQTKVLVQLVFMCEVLQIQLNISKENICFEMLTLLL